MPNDRLRVSSTGAWWDVQKLWTWSMPGTPVLLSGELIKAQWPRIPGSMLGQQKSNGHGCHHLLPWTGLGEGLLLSPEWVPEPGTNDRQLWENLGQIQLQLSHKKMRKNANKPKYRFHEKHWQETQEEAKNPNINTRRKNMKKKTYWGDQRKQREALRKEGHAQWWERTQASYERGKPREDGKARGFNYREHIKMK